jgi:hypothetical protein
LYLTVLESNIKVLASGESLLAVIPWRRMRERAREREREREAQVASSSCQILQNFSSFMVREEKCELGLGNKEG